MKKNILLLAVCCFLFSMGCAPEGNNSSATANTENNSGTTETSADAQGATNKPSTAADGAAETTSSEMENKEVLSWVDKLNIRAEPNKNAKVVATAKENESLTLTGNKSDQTETIELRGKTYTEPWVEVKTADGATGWVFGGAVKKTGEDKGNALNTVNNFTFPHFGSFDLSNWKKGKTDKSAGGDAENETNIYTKGNQILEINYTDVGEYGWSKTYKLMDASKKILKERTIEYSSAFDAKADDNVRKLEVTVKDFSLGKQFTRSNILKNYMSFDKNKLATVKGDWTTSKLGDTSTGSTSTTKSGASKFMLTAFEAYKCSGHVEKDFDCECVFNTGAYAKGQTLFSSDWGKNACVSVNGQLNALYPDWEGRDYKKELKVLSESKDWITVNGKELSYFGKQLADYKYEDPIEFLTDVILSSGKDIKVIPIKTTTPGSKMEEVKGYTAKAIAKAISYKAKGGADPLTIIKYDNRSYDVYVRYRQVTQHEGEANDYEGKITLLKNRDKEILETRMINGNCGC